MYPPWFGLKHLNRASVMGKKQQKLTIRNLQRRVNASFVLWAPLVN